MPEQQARGFVEIIRDEWGIPHVRSSSRRDAWFGQGYAHAQDRLWQMVFDRYKSYGRQSELIGKRGLSLDVFVRRVGIRQAAEADLALLTGEEKVIFDRYADGVNAAISDGATAKELELLNLDVDPWTAVDCHAVWKMRHVLMGSKSTKLWRWRLSTALGEEAVRKIATAHGREDVLIVPPGATERFMFEEFPPTPDMASEASNSWAIDGTRTLSGLPLIAGDPHRLLEQPSVYVQMQLVCDKFDVAGFTIPGVPGFPHFGQTESVAWCITHAMADDQDLFVEHFNSDGQVREPQGWSQPSRSTEVINVWDHDPVEIEVVRTDRGPVVFGTSRSSKAISMRWTGADKPTRGLACVGRMLEVNSAKQMDEEMREWVLPCNAFIAADVSGEIRFLHRGRVPQRPRANGWMPVPAWLPEHHWRDDVPFSEIPRDVNPEGGAIVTANNRVASATGERYLATDYAPSNRAKRIWTRLNEIDKATVEDMAAIHADNVSMAAIAVAETLLRIDPPTDSIESRAFDFVKEFHGAMSADSAAATIVAETREAVVRFIISRPEIAALEPSPFPEEPIQYSLHIRFRSALPRLLSIDLGPLEKVIWGGQSVEEVFATAFAEAVQLLREQFGDDPSEWIWEKTHLTGIRHPLTRRFPDEVLDPPEVSISGDGDTVCVSASEPGYGVYHASVARYVFDLSNRESSGWIVPLGSSADPGSKHHHDQMQMWSRCELLPIVSDWQRLEDSAVSHQRLKTRGL